MVRNNPDCPKCHENLWSIYTRKKQVYETLKNNLYCKKCKILYRTALTPETQEVKEHPKNEPTNDGLCEDNAS